uniref:Uncharacterized protein n=1 Tax=Arundo donax TaxID=35708 RepID=A0A0A8XUE3_ARUDO
MLLQKLRMLWCASFGRNLRIDGIICNAYTRTLASGEGPLHIHFAHTVMCTTKANEPGFFFWQITEGVPGVIRFGSWTRVSCFS